MFCLKCGKELSDQAEFCPACGTPVTKASGELPKEDVSAGSSASEGAQAGFSSDGASQSRYAAPKPPAVREETAVAVKEVPMPPEVVPADQVPAPTQAIQTVQAPEPPVQPEAAQKKKKGGKKKLLLAIPAIAAVLLVALIFGSGSGDQGDRPDAEDPGPAAQGEENEPEESLSQEGAEALMGYIDQAEQLCDQADEAYNALGKEVEDPTDDQVADFFRQKGQVMLTFLSDLEQLQQQANGVSGLDKNLKTARDEYFSMLQTSRTAYAQTILFLSDYLDFYGDFVQNRPMETDYPSTAEYSKALNQWSQDTSEAYKGISCPQSVEAEWEQYGEVLEYNAGIASKVAQAAAYQDWLRYRSSLNMEQRYYTMEEALYQKFLDCLKGEQNHAAKQRNVAGDLAEEMHTYTQMDPEEQQDYTFENIKTGRIWVNYDAVDTIYPSLYNTYDAFLIIKTGCISGTKTIFVEMEIPGFTQKYKERIQLDPSYRRVYIKPPALTGDLQLTSAKDAQINVTLYREDGSTMDAQTFPVKLKSKYDFEWYNDEYGVSAKDNILCFLTPEATAINQLKRDAIDEISAMTNGKMESFVGYQQAMPNWNQHTITYVQTAALMRAMYESGIRYNMDPFSISGSNQHILLPEDVIAQRSGLCIETSLVMASALQCAGMHAFLVFPPGHAQVAVEVWSSGENAGSYFLIETTALSGESNNRKAFVENANGLLKGNGSTGVITYYSKDSWKKYLQENVEYLIDCNDSRLLGLTPFAN